MTTRIHGCPTSDLEWPSLTPANVGKRVQNDRLKMNYDSLFHAIQWPNEKYASAAEQMV